MTQNKKSQQQRQTEALESIALSLEQIANNTEPVITGIQEETKTSTQELIEITDDGTKTTSQLLKDIGCKYYSFWSDKELDEYFPKPDKPTSRKFKWVQEADEEYANMSYNDLKEKGLIDKCISLRERIIYEKIWFEKNGTHLDINNWTLCAGSRNPIGYVPGVDWSSGYMHVSWFIPDARGDDLRARAAV